MDDPTLNLKIIKTKIKNLRSLYHTELKKIESSKRSGSGAATVYNPSTSWFQELHSFLGDTGEYREPMGLIQNTGESLQDSQPQASDALPNTLTPQSVNVLTPSPSPTKEDRPQSRSSNNSSTRRRKRSSQSQDDPITNALDRLENISCAINRQSEYDEFHYFAQNVAAHLRALPLCDALDVQNEISTILTTARRRYFEYPNLSTFTQTMTSTPPTTDTNTTYTYILPTTNTQSLTYTPTTYTNTTYTYTLPSTTNTQTMTCTLPTTNTMTYTLPIPATTTQSLTYTLTTYTNTTYTVPSTTNTQTMTCPPPTTNTMTCTLPVPATTTQTMPYTPPTTNTNTLTLPTTNTTVHDHDDHEQDLLTKAWKMCYRYE